MLRWLDGTIQEFGRQPSSAQVEFRHPRFDEIPVDSFEPIAGRSGGRSISP